MEHPITPPEELVQQWTYMWYAANNKDSYSVHIARAASQWALDQRGAANETELQKARDEELAACCEWLNKGPYGASLAVNGVIEQLRAARRLKTLSDADKAIKLIETYKCPGGVKLTPEQCDTIRRALERLKELENAQ